MLEADQGLLLFAQLNQHLGADWVSLRDILDFQRIVQVFQRFLGQIGT